MYSGKASDDFPTSILQCADEVIELLDFAALPLVS